MTLDRIILIIYLTYCPAGPDLQTTIRSVDYMKTNGPIIRYHHSPATWRHGLAYKTKRHYWSPCLKITLSSQKLHYCTRSLDITLFTKIYDRQHFVYKTIILDPILRQNFPHKNLLLDSTLDTTFLTKLYYYIPSSDTILITKIMYQTPYLNITLLTEQRYHTLSLDTTFLTKLLQKTIVLNRILLKKGEY